MSVTHAYPGARAPYADDKPRRRAFAAARRHTRVVRMLRIGLPAVCVFTLAFLAVSTIRFEIPGLPISLAGLGFDGRTVTMERPELTGYKAGRGSYRIEAEKAEQDVTEPHIVVLTGIDGKLSEDDGRWAQLRAGAGRLDTKEQVLVLSERIIVQADGGYRALMEDAHVDMREGIVTSDQPVQVDMLNGSLSADSMTLAQSGKAMTFEGRVSLNVIVGVQGAPLPVIGGSEEDEAQVGTDAVETPEDGQ